MQFIETPLAGAWLIEAEPRRDDRGHFSRVFCANEFEQHGLSTRLAQANIAYNHQRGITRGMHFQRAPHAEVKLVRCTRGRVFDAIVDMREGSPTRYQWYGVELTADNLRQLYVPEGFAHGYQVLEDASELHYLVSEFYTPHAEGGLRWDDPAVGIEWPITEGVLLSEKDAGWGLVGR